MSDVSKKVSLGTCFSIASVWFGSHAAVDSLPVTRLHSIS